MIYAIDVKWLVDVELYGEEKAQELREQRWADARGTYPDPVLPKRLALTRTVPRTSEGLVTRIWKMRPRLSRLQPAQ